MLNYIGDIKSDERPEESVEDLSEAVNNIFAMSYGQEEAIYLDDNRQLPMKDVVRKD